MIGVQIEKNNKLFIKDCGNDPVYAIKKILQFSAKAEIAVTIMVSRNRPEIKGQKDFEGDEVT
jgi:hypothetical protein